MQITLIRHAEMTGDPYACPESPVTGSLSEENGIPQARALARALAATHFDAALTSPLGRARQTAEIVLKDRNVPITVVPELREWIPSPQLQNASSAVYEEIVQKDRENFAEETWKSDLGEGCYEIYARVCPPFLKQLATLGIHARMGGYVPDERARDLSVAVFAHGGSLAVLLSFLLQMRPFPVGCFGFELTGVARVAFRERRGIYYPSLVIPAPVA